MNHQITVAQDESTGIASQLSAVPGYHYVDPPAGEVRQELAILKKDLAQRGAPTDFLHSASFHSVVADDASQNTARTSTDARETGFLQLRDFSPPPPADVDIAQLGTAGLSEIGSFKVANTKVTEYTDPTATPDSRYVLLWLRHGVWAAFDGATRSALERWVRAYLAIPEHQPKETNPLSAALTAVSGYAYVNFWDDTTANFSHQIFDGASAVSIHAVVNDRGSFGTLLLASADSSITDASVTNEVATQFGATPGKATIAGLAVNKITDASGRAAYVWVRNGIVAVFLSGYPHIAESFLQKYMQG